MNFTFRAMEKNDEISNEFLINFFTNLNEKFKTFEDHEIEEDKKSLSFALIRKFIEKLFNDDAEEESMQNLFNDDAEEESMQNLFNDDAEEESMQNLFNDENEEKNINEETQKEKLLSKTFIKTIDLLEKRRYRLLEKDTNENLLKLSQTLAEKDTNENLLNLSQTLAEKDTNENLLKLSETRFIAIVFFLTSFLTGFKKDGFLSLFFLTFQNSWSIQCEEELDLVFSLFEEKNQITILKKLKELSDGTHKENIFYTLIDKYYSSMDSLFNEFSTDSNYIGENFNNFIKLIEKSQEEFSILFQLPFSINNKARKDYMNEVIKLTKNEKSLKTFKESQFKFFLKCLQNIDENPINLAIMNAKSDNENFHKYLPEDVQNLLKDLEAKGLYNVFLIIPNENSYEFTSRIAIEFLSEMSKKNLFTMYNYSGAYAKSKMKEINKEDFNKDKFLEHFIFDESDDLNKYYSFKSLMGFLKRIALTERFNFMLTLNENQDQEKEHEAKVKSFWNELQEEREDEIAEFEKVEEKEKAQNQDIKKEEQYHY